MSEKVQCRYCSKTFQTSDQRAVHVREHHPTPDAEELDAVSKRAIFEYLTGDGTDTGLREKAKQANAYRATEARREASQNAKEATTVMLARGLANNPEEFQAYMKLAMPNTPMLKALPPTAGLAANRLKKEGEDEAETTH